MNKGVKTREMDRLNQSRARMTNCCPSMSPYQAIKLLLGVHIFHSNKMVTFTAPGTSAQFVDCLCFETFENSLPSKVDDRKLEHLRHPKDNSASSRVLSCNRHCSYSGSHMIENDNQ